MRRVQIFLLYTRKLESQIPDNGLGFLDTKAEMIPISITVQEPAWDDADQRWQAGRGAKAKKGRKAPKEVTVELELHQDLDKLRNRPGDTGAWRRTTRECRADRPSQPLCCGA